MRWHRQAGLGQECGRVSLAGSSPPCGKGRGAGGGWHLLTLAQDWERGEGCLFLPILCLSGGSRSLHPQSPPHPPSESPPAS